MPLNIIQVLFFVLISATFLIVGIQIWREKVSKIFKFIPFLASLLFLIAGAKILVSEFVIHSFRQDLSIIINTVIVTVLIKQLIKAKGIHISLWLILIMAYIGVLVHFL
jgi:hypothetical protein